MTNAFDTTIYKDSSKNYAFCDALEEISKCKDTVPNCHPEFKGLTHAIANVGLNFSFQ